MRIGWRLPTPGRSRRLGGVGPKFVVKVTVISPSCLLSEPHPRTTYNARGLGSGCFVVDNTTLHHAILAKGGALRAQYLDWVRTMQSVRDHSLRHPGSSTGAGASSAALVLLPAHNSLEPNSIASSVVRILALLDILRSCDPSSRVIVQGNSVLGEIVREWSITDRPDIRVEVLPGNETQEELDKTRLRTTAATALLRYLRDVGTNSFSSPLRRTRVKPAQFALLVLDYTSHIKVQESGLGFASNRS